MRISSVPALSVALLEIVITPARAASTKIVKAGAALGRLALERHAVDRVEKSPFDLRLHVGRGLIGIPRLLDSGIDVPILVETVEKRRIYPVFRRPAHISLFLC